MGLAPLLYAAYIVGSPEVVPVLRFFEPTLLACRFSCLAALGLGAISLPSPVPAVGSEEDPAAPALSLSGSICHCPPTSADQWINAGRKRIKQEEAKLKKTLCGILGKKIQGMFNDNYFFRAH